MAVLKGIFAGVLALAGLALVGLGSMSAAVLRQPASALRSAPSVALRPFPAGASAAAAPLKAPPRVPDEVEVPDAGPLPEPVKAVVPDAGAPAPRPVVVLGLLNLHASDTADVYVDGRRVGSSPIDGLKVRVGTRRVRFDCYDSAGNAVVGPVKSVTVTTDQTAEVAFTCPAAE